MSTRRNTRGRATRQYPRTARLNRLMREILAEELELVDEEVLEQVAITSVVVDPDLRHATVYFDSLGGEETDESVGEALAAARVRLQAAIGRQARLKRIPELAFRPDPAVREGSKIEAILAEIGPLPDVPTDPDGVPARGSVDPTTEEG